MSARTWGARPSLWTALLVAVLFGLFVGATEAQAQEPPTCCAAGWYSFTGDWGEAMAGGELMTVCPSQNMASYTQSPPYAPACTAPQLYDEGQMMSCPEFQLCFAGIPGVSELATAGDGPEEPDPEPSPATEVSLQEVRVTIERLLWVALAAMAFFGYSVGRRGA